MTLARDQALVGATTDSRVCASCLKPIKGVAFCKKCHYKSEQEAFDQAAEEAEEAMETSSIADQARDWLTRRRLVFPAEITREVSDAFELFIRDVEDGQC